MRILGHLDLTHAIDGLAARVPDQLAVFARLAYNYRWSWAPDGDAIFADVDADRWRRCSANPVRLLEEASMDNLEAAAKNDNLLDRARAVAEVVDADLARPSRSAPVTEDRPVAFFCAEYAIHQSLPIYSGGLGALAGDIVKEMSDLAVPFVGIGLLYAQGYFRQRIDESGWQREYWVDTDPQTLPAVVVTKAGEPVTVGVDIGRRHVHARIWRVDVGRSVLYLLDTDLASNERIDRSITSRLYDGNATTRQEQYAMLGIGGMRALAALGIDPGVIHLNEGHAALAPLELAHELAPTSTDPLDAARGRTLFTTHTPVAAGNDAYDADDVLGVLGSYPDDIGIGVERFIALGRTDPADGTEKFGVTQLGLRMSNEANGVSRRHGGVARRMWQDLYPGTDVDDVPIGYVTNGVHIPTWIDAPMRELLDEYLGDGWMRHAADPAAWAGVDDIPDAELWQVRNEQRESLVEFVRERSVVDRLARGEPLEYVEAAERAFDAGVVTIGFARRLATYKRLDLVLRDVQRALGLLGGDHPIQILIAGKAHPSDDAGKRALQGVLAVRSSAGVGDRAAVLHDYGLGIAQRLVSGCDVWVNLPRPPQEASGTSGMKSAMNGGLNLSVLDGWWDEAYDGENGWAISGEVDADTDAQDARHASALYGLLENEVVPTFYDRRPDGVPHAWIARVKHSLKTNGPQFCATRMVSEYLAGPYTRLSDANRR